jgi:hypothetical protein
VKRAAENASFRVQSAVIDLHLVASLDRRPRAVDERWAAQEHPRVVLRLAETPFDREEQIVENFVRIPESPEPP